MLIHTALDGVPATASLTDEAVTVAVGDDLVIAWDRGGRLYSMVEGERTYRRGLNGRVLAKWRERGERRYACPGEAEARALVDRAATVAAGVRQRVAEPPDVGDALQVAADFDARAAFEDAARFRQIYQPIGILPPDRYLSLVLQATEGCSFHSCTFCEFYREPYRVKNARDFATHVEQVRGYLGDSLCLRQRSVFLGSANALAVPMSGLVPVFDVVASRFPGRPVFAFLDGFTGVLKDAADYRELAARGLRRVYIGLESGDDELLAFVGKPATRDQAVHTARAIKAAGVNVGIIVMVGLGGDRFAGQHVTRTAAAVNEVDLGEGDLLYFSELVAASDSPYTTQTAEAGIRELDAEERTAQRHAIERRLLFGTSRPKIATYDVREFVY